MFQVFAVSYLYLKFNVITLFSKSHNISTWKNYAIVDYIKRVNENIKMLVFSEADLY